MTVLLPTGKQVAPVSIGVKLPEELETAIMDVIHTAVHKTAQDIRHADKFPEYMNQTQAAKYLGISAPTSVSQPSTLRVASTTVKPPLISGWQHSSNKHSSPACNSDISDSLKRGIPTFATP